MNEPRYTISERLKEMMATLGLSQAQIAERIGVARADISRYVTGARLPRQDKIAAISEAYNIDPAWLIGFDVPMRKKLSATQAQEDFELLDKWHKLNPTQKEIINMTIDNFLGISH